MRCKGASPAAISCQCNVLKGTGWFSYVWRLRPCAELLLCCCCLQAVPCEAFCEAMCTANPDQASLLRSMLPWYDTPGTPELTISTSYSPSNESLTITIKQRNDTAKDVDKALNKPLLIPFKVRTHLQLTAMACMFEICQQPAQQKLCLVLACSHCLHLWKTGNQHQS